MVVTVNGKPKALVLKVSDCDIKEVVNLLNRVKAQLALEKLRTYSLENGLDSMSEEEINTLIEEGRMRVVLDTNVVVSGVLNPGGKPAKILNLVLNGNIALCLDSRIFDEYRRVLSHPKFNFPKEVVRDLLDSLKALSIFVSPRPLDLNVPDRLDIPFIEVALSENIPLITRNKRDLEGIRGLLVYSPSEFLETFHFPK